MDDCECVDCQTSDTPCKQDCDNDNVCAGCVELRAEWAERTFEERKYFGYI